MSFTEQVKKYATKFFYAALEELEPEFKTAARAFMIKKLERVTVYDLLEGIEGGYDVWNAAPERDKRLGIGLAKRGKKVYLKYEKAINTDAVMGWLARDRSDLHDVIYYYPTPKAKEWLGRNVERAKEMLREEMRI